MPSFYWKMPEKIKNMIGGVYYCIPDNIKYGRKYTEYKHLLENSQNWTQKQHNDYQFKKMKDLLIYANNHVPYYHKLFEEIKFEPLNMTDIRDVEIIPFLDKDIIEKNFSDLISDEYSPNDYYEATTGGTTGHQLRFLLPNDIYKYREKPFVDSIWGRVGYNKCSKVAELRNKIIDGGKLYEWDALSHRYIIDTYNLTENNIRKILQLINDKKIEFIHTYPSIAIALAEIAQKESWKSSSLKAILATSENLYAGQREMLEKAFNCRVFSFYGHSECAVIAGECEKSTAYHVQDEYGYFELTDDNGVVISEKGIRGEIVCTGFDNYVMPLIRYRTHDYTKYSQTQHCECGRNYVLIDGVDGRWTQEKFIGKDGNKIAMASINMHSSIYKNVLNYQFVQMIPGECLLKIVKDESYSQNDEILILNELGKKFGNNMIVSIEYVNEIQRTPRGKQQFIVQTIK